MQYGQLSTGKKCDKKSLAGQESGDQVWAVNGTSILRSACRPPVGPTHRRSLRWRRNHFSLTNVSLSPCAGKAPSPTLHSDAAHIPRQYPRQQNHFPPRPGMWLSSPGSHSGSSFHKEVWQKFKGEQRPSRFPSLLFHAMASCNSAVPEDLWGMFSTNMAQGRPFDSVA